jgi:uncharacterized protein involved in response to NO
MQGTTKALKSGAGEAPHVRAEKQSQAGIEAFLATGLFLLLLPGTFLGVWNLIGISRHHSLSALSSAWLQVHGQAQIFGWVGSLILGIGFYSLTKMQNTRAIPNAGCLLRVSMEPLANELDWQLGWRLLPVSAVIELTAAVLFALNLVGTLMQRPAHLLRSGEAAT